MAVSHNNAFDLVRHVAAIAVLVSHHYALSGLEQPGLGGPHTLGALAVLAFFSISGYLIALSFCRSASFHDYLIKRLARLFPALVVCAFTMVFLAAPLLSERGLLRLLDGRTWFELLRISAMGQANLDDVTQSFIFAQSFNGSLWTLKIEFACYLAVAVLLSRSHRAVLPFCAVILLGGLTWYFDQHAQGALVGKLAIYGSVASAFFLGAFCALQRSWLSRRGVLLTMIVAGIGLLALSPGSAFTLLLGSAAVCLITLGVGLSLRDRLIRGRFDISYGIYLYAFPVQQIIINRTGLDFYSGMLVTLLIVLCLATLSWRLVERPALDYAHRLTSRAQFAGELR